MEARKHRKGQGLFICLLAYMAAGLMIWLVYDAISILPPILVAFLLNIVATITVFLFSMAFNNSSLYDPYWSLAPPVIILYWVFHEQTLEALTGMQILIFGLVIFWSVRLTLNWILRWRGIKDEDWRYIAYRFRFQEQYWVVSFFGLHLFPTLIVFIALLPLYPALLMHEGSMETMEWVAAGVTFTGLLIEMISDWQLRRFLRKGDDRSFCRTGLWKYSRHPNYFGEVLFWVGLFLFSMGLDQVYWWTIPGPLLMILLFYTISIPMMDKRMMRRRTGYRHYIKQTSALIPWPPRKRATASSITPPRNSG